MPNLPLPTLGGKQLWADLRWRGGWRVQENLLTGHARLLDERDIRRAWGSVDACLEAFAREAPAAPAASSEAHLVVLLHGLGRSRAVWAKMRTVLEAQGFTVAALSYPSTRRSPRDHAKVLAELLGEIHGYRQVDFVTHSMGGIVVRELLALPNQAWRQSLPPHHLVMLAPPNQGSALAERLDGSGKLRWLLGPAPSALTPAALDALPYPELPTLVIAGSRGQADGWNPLIPGDDDGVVSVDACWMDGREQRLVVRGIHTFLMNRPDVLDATVHFLAQP